MACQLHPSMGVLEKVWHMHGRRQIQQFSVAKDNNWKVSILCSIFKWINLCMYIHLSLYMEVKCVCKFSVWYVYTVECYPAMRMNELQLSMHRIQILTLITKTSYNKYIWSLVYQWVPVISAHRKPKWILLDMMFLLFLKQQILCLGTHTSVAKGSCESKI